MSACIGWDADTTCPAWNMPTHGCKYKPGHRGTPHRCECGAVHPQSLPIIHRISKLSTSNPPDDTTTLDDMNGDEPYEPGVNLEFNMPASWEDMEALGLDPLTGYPA